MQPIFLDALLWRLMAFAERARVLTLLFWAALTALAAWQVSSNIAISTDTSEMISPEAPHRQASAKINAAFPKLSEQVLVVVEASTADGAAAFTDELSARLRERDEVQSLLAAPSEPFFRQNGLLFLDVDELEDLLARLTKAAPLLERLGPDPTVATLLEALAEAAEQENGAITDQETLDRLYTALADVITNDEAIFSWQALLSTEDDPSNRVLFTLQPVLDYSRLRPAQAVKEAILEEADAVRAETGFAATVMITGDPVLRSEELEAVSRGIGWAFALSGVLVGLLLYVALSSKLMVTACLLSIILSVVLTAGIAVTLFDELNLISVAFAVLMVGLGADFSIHLLVHLRTEVGNTRSLRTAFYRTARKIGTALALAAPTTALAFFSFAPTEFIGMNQLGVIAGVGVLIAFLVSVTLIPALLGLFPSSLGRRALAEVPETRPSTMILDRAVIPFGLVVGGLGVASIALLPQARFDADPMALRAKSAPSVVALNLISEEEGASPYRLSVLAADEDDVRAKARALGQPETVDSTRHLFSFVPDDQALKLDLIDAAAVGLSFALMSGGSVDDELAVSIARLETALSEGTSDAGERLLTTLRSTSMMEIDGAAPRIFLFWPRQRSLLQEQLLAGYVTVDDLPSSLTARYAGDDGLYRIEILPVDGALTVQERRAFVRDVLAVAPDAAGSARSALAAGDIIGQSMVQASLTAAALVSILVLLFLRSFKLLLLLLVPLVLAGSLTTATGTLFDIPYNFANVLVLPLIIGIGIDSGLHLALQAERRGDGLAAVRGPTGRAVLYSALTTIASFGSLVISEHRGTSSMGALLTVGMIWVLATMLFVLPPLAGFLYKRRSQTP
ncbi:MAG: MMPL family transporter [Pseudomonadota bacterium]